MVAVISLPTIEVLRRHILETLCSHDLLDPRQAVVHEGVIRRSGRPCGLFVQVSGTRKMNCYAVWAGDENRVLYYDSGGRRFAETRLSESPDATALAHQIRNPKSAQSSGRSIGP